MTEISEQQGRVLRLIADGYDTDGISEELGISYETVRQHISRLKRKFGCARFVDLPDCARANGVRLE